MSVCGAAAWPVFRHIEPRSWLNLLAGHDMRVAARPMREKMVPRIRIFQRHAAPWHRPHNRPIDRSPGRKL
ncbi:hypothetical protein Veis_1690 [Verminephrobacter eiseniae EF01-2]|uniref:Uncharacterized protein n=1 Tax=Verminephrobacter eiseniae (strain EF01-2) TaxID=391735 RepID=A1WII8_VEREI|nr:hypothetical protein Veis_1690 [Verminephrobacter eiseniae EF01-2]